MQVKEISGKEYIADEVIMAVPLKVAEKISYDPPLSLAKQTALENMPVINLTRTFLKTDDPFWVEKELSGAAFTDLGVGQVNAYSNVDDPETNSILEAYVAGPQAKKLASLSKEETLREMKSQMAKVHPEIKDHYQEGYTKSWDNDPYALGGPSWPGPRDITNYLKDLQASHGHITFAGEYTSVLRSTMEGALRSGITAAKRVHKA